MKSKDQLFFAIFPPYFQSEVVKKFKENDKIEIVEETKGGIEFKSKLENFYEILFENLGIVRYLLRIKKFSCKNFQKLYSYIEKIDWSLYIPDNIDIDINVTTNKSRLYHSDAISQRVKDAIMKNRKIGNNKVTIFIRIDNDIVNVSLDLVGDPLFKRGWKSEFVKAPIRENLANLILSEIDLDKYHTFCDPMCGSGTFIYEILFLKRLVFPYRRNFNFENCPFFSEKTYLYNKKKYYEKITNQIENIKDEIKFIVSDININSAKINLSEIQKELSLLNQNKIKIELIEKDFFELDMTNLLDNNKSLVIFNPPYGERIAINNERKFFEKINDKILFLKKHKVDIVIVIPEDKIKYFNERFTKKIKFKNGNIVVDALYYL